MDRALLGANTQGQSGLRSNGNEEVFCIPQSSSITGTSPKTVYCHITRWWGEPYHSAAIQSMFSTAPTDWSTHAVVPSNTEGKLSVLFIIDWWKLESYKQVRDWKTKNQLSLTPVEVGFDTWHKKQCSLWAKEKRETTEGTGLLYQEDIKTLNIFYSKNDWNIFSIVKIHC